MKKSIFALMALLIAFAISFSACDKPIPTNEELLCQSKGWELFSATSNPPFTNKAGVTNANLFESFFFPWEKDDILFFNKNKSSFMNFGKILEPGTTEKEVSLGNWRFLKDEKVLEFHLPYFFNDDDSFATLEASISLDENSMTLIMDIKYDNGVDPVKGRIVNDRGILGAKSVVDYVFTFAYKVAK
jgi:hypothetical protein